jgi:hypothetical protein
VLLVPVNVKLVSYYNLRGRQLSIRRASRGRVLRGRAISQGVPSLGVRTSLGMHLTGCTHRRRASHGRDAKVF